MFAPISRLYRSNALRNFSYLTLGSILSQLIGIFTVFRITHILTPEDYGQFSFLNSQGLLLFTLSDLGIKNIIIRRIARDKQLTKNLLVTGTLMRGVAMTGMLLLYIIYNKVFGNLGSYEIFIIFVLCLTYSVSQTFETLFFGLEKMLFPSIANLFFALLWFLVVAVLPKDLMSVEVLLLVYIILTIAKGCFLFGALKINKLISGKRVSVLPSANSLMKESWPYFLMILLLLPFTSLYNNFLTLNSNLNETGYFSLAFKVISPISFFLDFILASIFPRLAFLWSDNKQSFWRMSKDVFCYTVVSMLLICFLFSFFIENLFLIFFPPSYLEVVNICKVYVWYMFFVAIDSFMGTILGAINKEKVVLKLAFYRSLLATPILFAGSYHGAIGLAYGYVISFSLFQLYLWYMFKKTTGISISFSHLFWPASAFLFYLSIFHSMNFSILYKLAVSGALVLSVAGILYRRSKSIIAE